MFKGQVLPTVLESVTFIFLVENLDTVDVTHLLRHRAFSFSAHCTGDRDQRMDSAMIKPSMYQNQYLRNKIMAHIDDSKKLYIEMLDYEGVSILDARTILPRCLENHYYVKTDLKSFIGFLHQRLDRQIQPESDNILAIRMLIEVAKVLPEIKYAIDLDRPDAHYVKTAQTDHSSNMYMPEKPRNDVFNYKEQWFINKKQRSEMKGGEVFINLWNKLRKELNEC